MIDRVSAREHFIALTHLPDSAIDLGEAALWIAAEEQPGLDPEPWLERLDELGCRLEHRLRGARGELDRLSALTGLLFAEERLRGNAEDFYDPRNNLLNQVLERRLGIPLTLAVVCIEVGRRAGVLLEGVGFPGHFLLRLARHPQVCSTPSSRGGCSPSTIARRCWRACRTASSTSIRGCCALPARDRSCSAC